MEWQWYQLPNQQYQGTKIACKIRQKYKITIAALVLTTHATFLVPLTAIVTAFMFSSRRKPALSIMPPMLVIMLQNVIHSQDKYTSEPNQKTWEYILLCPSRGAKYCSEYARFSASLFTYHENYTAELHKICCSCRLRPWLGPPLVHHMYSDVAMEYYNKYNNRPSEIPTKFCSAMKTRK